MNLLKRKSPRLIAFVLAAGYGTRLRPLTYFIPKPLLPIRGEAVVGHTLRSLARLGCESAILNLHHMGDAISGYFGPEYHGLPISYSREEQILGTLGALFPLREHLAQADLVLLVNGDTLCDWPWKKLIRQHLRTEADATLLLHKRLPNQALGGPVGVDRESRVVQLRSSEPIAKVARHHVFMGAHVLAPHLLGRLTGESMDIIGDLYIPLLRENRRIQAVVTARKWHDLGTPERYLAASLDWARRGKLPGLGRGGLSSLQSEIDENASLSRAFVGEDAVVQAQARVEESIVLDGAVVSTGCVIRGSIIGPGVEIPAAARIEQRMVTSIRSGSQPGPRDSVMGDLVYTPMASSD